ncbi:MAG: DUF6477 family protein [Pseudomonadota bacterium]
MSDLRTLVSALRRPRLLVRAARIGLQDYDRDRDLRRLMQTQKVPTPERAVSRLIEEENMLETTRVGGDASYSVLRHVEILIALMAEVRLLPVARV